MVGVSEAFAVRIADAPEESDCGRSDNCLTDGGRQSTIGVDERRLLTTWDCGVVTADQRGPANGRMFCGAPTDLNG